MAHICGANDLMSLPMSLLQGVDCAGGAFAQRCLQPREGLLDWFEVGRVGRRPAGDRALWEVGRGSGRLMPSGRGVIRWCRDVAEWLKAQFAKTSLLPVRKIAEVPMDCGCPLRLQGKILRVIVLSPPLCRISPRVPPPSSSPVKADQIHPVTFIGRPGETSPLWGVFPWKQLHQVEAACHQRRYAGGRVLTDMCVAVTR
jgi:hypothetical protein